MEPPIVSEPKKFWLTRRLMSLSMQISERQFDNYDITPIARCGQSKYYDVHAVLKNRVDHIKGRLIQTGDGEATITKSEADLQLTIAKVEKEKLDHLIKLGKYIPVEHLEAIFAKLSSVIGSQLDSTAAIIKRKFPDLPLDVISEIDGALRLCMNNISNIDSELDEILEELNEESGSN